jgi:hypothetical protein
MLNISLIGEVRIQPFGEAILWNNDGRSVADMPQRVLGCCGEHRAAQHPQRLLVWEASIVRNTKPESQVAASRPKQILANRKYTCPTS